MDIFDSLACWIAWLAQEMWFYFVETLEALLDVLVAVANAIFSVLPTVDLPEPSADGGVVGALNYVVPVDVYLVTATTIISAWIIYKIVEWGLRWAKAEE